MTPIPVSTLTATPVTAVPVPAPIPLTGVLCFSAGTVDKSYIGPGNPRGYNNQDGSGIRLIHTMAGAEAYSNWILGQIPVAQRTTTAVLFMKPGGYLDPTIQSLPVDYAAGLESIAESWMLIASRLTAYGIPFGIACRPAENYNGAAGNRADPTQTPDQVFLQNQLQRCMKLFPSGAKRIWYADSVNGGANFNQSLGMLQLMRETVGPNDLILPECFGCSPDQALQLGRIGGGIFQLITTPQGDSLVMNAAQLAWLKAAGPTLQIVGAQATGYPTVSAAQRRAVGVIPLLDDSDNGLVPVH